MVASKPQYYYRKMGGSKPQYYYRKMGGSKPQYYYRKMGASKPQYYSRVAYIYIRSRAKYLKFRTTTSKINTLGKPLMQQKYYFIHEL